jgi:hypothetical protein
MVRVSVNGFSTRSEHANHYTTDVVNMYQCNTDMIEDTNENSLEWFAKILVLVVLTKLCNLFTLQDEHNT